MTPTLEQHLMSLNGDVLKGWLRRMDAMEKGSTRKEQFVQAIERQLTLNLPKVLERLTLEEKCFLAECATKGASSQRPNSRRSMRANVQCLGTNTVSVRRFTCWRLSSASPRTVTKINLASWRNCKNLSAPCCPSQRESKHAWWTPCPKRGRPNTNARVETASGPFTSLRASGLPLPSLPDCCAW